MPTLAVVQAMGAAHSVVVPRVAGQVKVVRAKAKVKTAIKPKKSIMASLLL
jgi:hypothetical protein